MYVNESEWNLDNQCHANQTKSTEQHYQSSTFEVDAIEVQRAGACTAGSESEVAQHIPVIEEEVGQGLDVLHRRSNQLTKLRQRQVLRIHWRLRIRDLEEQTMQLIEVLLLQSDADKNLTICCQAIVQLWQ
jgi:hypothetical protein